jgi:TetR/AcrR family transcriptional repressor of nem operon
MASAIADTRTRLVESARYLFWERGFAGTGLADILARAHANSGSFYHFFESKDALLRTVLDTYVGMLDPFVIQPAWAKTTDPIERVFSLLEGYRQRLVDTDCQYGCPIGRLALEIDAENMPAHALIARNFAAWKAAVEACLRAAGLANPDDAAAMVLALMEGAVMQARAERRLDAFDACVRELRTYFDSVKSSARRPRRVSTART